MYLPGYSGDGMAGGSMMYGGTGRGISYMTEGLVRRGHEVTLFVSGDSVTEARLIPACGRSLRPDKDCGDQLVHHAFIPESVCRHIEAVILK